MRWNVAMTSIRNSCQLYVLAVISYKLLGEGTSITISGGYPLLFPFLVLADKCNGFCQVCKIFRNPSGQVRASEAALDIPMKKRWGSLSASPDGISVAASSGYPSTGRSPALPVSVSPDDSQYSSEALCCQRGALAQMARKSRRYSSTTWLQKMACGSSSKGFYWLIGGKSAVFGQS